MLRRNFHGFDAERTVNNVNLIDCTIQYSVFTHLNLRAFRIVKFPRTVKYLRENGDTGILEWKSLESTKHVRVCNINENLHPWIKYLESYMKLFGFSYILEKVSIESRINAIPSAFVRHVRQIFQVVCDLSTFNAGSMAALKFQWRTGKWIVRFSRRMFVAMVPFGVWNRINRNMS